MSAERPNAIRERGARGWLRSRPERRLQLPDAGQRSLRNTSLDRSRLRVRGDGRFTLRV